MNQSSDSDIRIALHQKILKRHHNCPDTFVVDELGLAHGKSRVDIAVLNGCLHGYEIKSAKDTLKRFPGQLEEYSRALQKLTVVIAPNHLDEALEMLPSWCGVILAEMGPRGGVSFQRIRSAQQNPCVCPEAVAHLLWRNEAIELLESLGAEKSILRQPRKALYSEIVSHVSISDLVEWVKAQFMKRETWRVDRQLA